MKKLRYLFFVLLTVYSSHCIAQLPREYKKYEVIELTNGLKVEIIGNRGEGPSREVDVIYYTDKRQNGNRMWQLASVLYQEENAALISKGLKPLYKISEPEKPKPDTIINALVLVEPIIISEEIAIEAEEAETPPLIPVSEIKEPTPAIKPIKEKEEIKLAEETIIEITSEEILPAITYKIVMPSFDSGARHNFIIGLDSNNNPFLPDDTISADTFTKPYNNLVPPEVIEAFKKEIIFPLPIHIPIDLPKPQPTTEPTKAEQEKNPKTTNKKPAKKD